MSQNITEKPGSFLPNLPVLAAVNIAAGDIVAIDSSGYLVHPDDASQTNGEVVLGRAEEDADNTSGSNGDLTCTVKRGALVIPVDDTNPPTAAHVGRRTFAKDKGSVSTQENAEAPAGVLLGFTESGAAIVDVNRAPEEARLLAAEARLTVLETP